MTISEQDLRELLRERSEVVPSSSDRVDAVKQRVRRQRRFEAAAVGAGLVAAVVAVAAVVIPRVGDVSPTPVPPATQSATPGPQVTGSATYDGIRMDTSGPATVHGTTPFTVTVTVTNTTTQEWRGAVDVGVHRPGPRPDAADNLFITSPAAPTDHVDIAQLPDGLTELDGVRTGDLVLAAGASTVVTLRLERSPSTVAHPDIHGWVPWIAGTPTTSLDPSGFSLVVVDPREVSANACTTFEVTTATETRLPQQLLGAATTTMTPLSAPITWTAVTGLPGSFAPSVAGADVDVVTVASALGAYGIGTLGTASSREPDTTTPPGKAGSFVSYSGIEPVDVTFTGRCGLADGTVVPAASTGVLHTYTIDEQGMLDCALDPPPKSVAHVASAYCPNGSKARLWFQAH